MHRLEHKVPPPLLVLLFGVAMWITARATATVPLVDPWRLALALTFVLAGFAITMLGGAAFRRAATTIDPVRIERASTLVTGGIFRLTRNPMYVGFTTVLIGWACWLSSPWALCGPVAFALFITRFQIVPEETVMRAKFGAQYDAYRRRVRRWL